MTLEGMRFSQASEQAPSCGPVIYRYASQAGGALTVTATGRLGQPCWPHDL